jgi:hypothetical protein
MRDTSYPLVGMEIDYNIYQLVYTEEPKNRYILTRTCVWLDCTVIRKARNPPRSRGPGKNYFFKLMIPGTI